MIDQFDRERIEKELAVHCYRNVVILHRVEFFRSYNNHYDGYFVRAQNMNDLSYEMLFVVLWEDMFWMEMILGGGEQ